MRYSSSMWNIEIIIINWNFRTTKERRESQHNKVNKKIFFLSRKNCYSLWRIRTLQKWVSTHYIGHTNLKSGFSTKSLVELSHAQLNHKLCPSSNLHGPTHNIFHAHFLHWWIIILTYVNKYTTLSFKNSFFQINDNKFFCLTHMFCNFMYLNIRIETFFTFILNFWNFKKIIFKSSRIKQKLKFCKEIF